MGFFLKPELSKKTSCRDKDITLGKTKIVDNAQIGREPTHQKIILF
jgi:hypothetical protein